MLDYVTDTYVGDLYVEEFSYTNPGGYRPVHKNGLIGNKIGWEQYNEPVGFQMRGRVLAQNVDEPFNMNNTQLLFVTGKYSDQEAYLIKTIMDDPGLLYKVLRDLGEEDLAREVLAKITD